MSTRNNCIIKGQKCSVCETLGNENGTQERHYVNGLIAEGKREEDIQQLLQEDWAAQEALADEHEAERRADIEQGRYVPRGGRGR